jgi:glucose/arabinose dehydrogenase/uncharacterized cupredoxin-like copper-binding protein
LLWGKRVSIAYVFDHDWQGVQKGERPMVAKQPGKVRDDHAQTTTCQAPSSWQRKRFYLFVALALAQFGWLTVPTVFADRVRQTEGAVVQVSLVDGAIDMPTELPAGPTTFAVTNNGTMAHNFEIEGQGLEQVFEENLQPGESNTLQVDLPPGDYRVYCPVGNHAAQGMELTLTVTEAAGAGTVPQAMTTTAEATGTAAITATAAVTATSETTGTPARAGQTVMPSGELPGTPALALVKVAEGLADPVNVAAPADGSGRLFIVERIGRIRIVQDGELLEAPFLDLSEVVKTDFLEQGLLGLAFHPNYAENGRFFVYYSDWRTNGDTFLVEFSVSADDPNVADPESAKVLLTYDQPYVNHNGGTLHFGPDGYLYLAKGDGGLAGDPYRNAQDLSTLWGKLLRIDVDGENGQAYRIPEDNPFLGQVGYSPVANEAAQDGDYLPDARPEIWAYGLRNPWQFSFDPATGDLYITDVGQNLWEEINVIEAGSVGARNFGWPVMEGAHCYPEESECGTFGVLPVAEYDHSEENCTITGIGVYRGQLSTTLDGIYFNADYCSGRFWGLTRADSGEWLYAELLDTDLQVSGAGMDEAGELYVTACTCEYERGYDPLENPGGTVWQLMAADQVPEGAETATTPAAAPEEVAEGTTAPAGEGNPIPVSLVDGVIEMPASIPAGLTTFAVTNDGTMAHNFEIEGGDLEEQFDENLQPGESNTMTVDLPAGEYEIYCPVGDHRARGMELTLTVE